VFFDVYVYALLDVVRLAFPVLASGDAFTCPKGGKLMRLELYILSSA
jgi:hypothetical protein